VVQIKNFMAMAIVIYAIRFLIEEDNLQSTFKYLVLNVLAAGFHIYSVICLPLILLKKWSFKKLISTVLTITFMFCVVAFSRKYYTNRITIFVST